jgi:hypothetical protein
MKSLYLDFEYRYPSERDLVILCCAWEIDGEEPNIVWLEDDEERRHFAHTMWGLAPNHVFVAYAVEAEARCLFQLWEEFDLPYMELLKDKTLRFVDLMLEYRMLLNHNHELAYGKQLINGKEVKTVPPKPKWDRTSVIRNESHGKITAAKPEYNLAAACFKMLNVKIDTEEKDYVRDLIISNKPLTAQEKSRVQSYCLTDTDYLPALHEKISKFLFIKTNATAKTLEKLRTEVYARGEYAARTAIMTRLGYPYSHKALKHFSGQVKNILHDEIHLIEEAHPEVKAFQFNKKAEDYVKKEEPIREWIAKHCDTKSWPKTEAGKLSLALDAFIEHFDKEDTSFGGALRRYLKLKQDLNGFMPPKPNQKRKIFWDSAGSDYRARPYYGIYGSQSARSQPSATGFIPLKANWMRAFIVPPEGKAICSIDYSSQEFLISALISEDEEMINAYDSGDPYTYFAKLDGAIPNDGDKTTHPKERDIYKVVTLGIGYLMGSNSLATRLTKALGTNYSSEDAQDLINSYNSAFNTFHEWQNEVIEDYGARGKRSTLKLPCGWCMFGDNKNPKSVGNFPIQGFGSSIMRKAVEFAQDEGLDVIFTLHDAIYVEYPSQCIDYTVALLSDCMDRAFKFYFPEHLKSKANCRVDVFCWSSDYKDYKHKIYPTNHFYLDKKGIDGYNKFRKYLNFL